MPLGLTDNRGRPRLGRVLGLVFVAFVIVFLVFSFAFTVPTGRRGILLTWGKAQGVLEPGLHFKVPIMQTVEMMNVEVQKAESTESAASHDLQDVYTTIAINYRLQMSHHAIMDIFTNFRHDYANRVIKPNIEESLKASTAQFTATELITLRPQVKAAFEQILGERLAPFYIEVLAVSLTDFQFNEQFSHAIEEKVTAEQEALKAKNYLEQVRYEAEQMVVKAEAQKAADIARAEGEALARVIQANASATSNMVLADAEAYRIELINQKIADNPAYIQWSWIQQWDGQLPATVFGDENIDLLLQGMLPD